MLVLHPLSVFGRMPDRLSILCAKQLPIHISSHWVQKNLFNVERKGKYLCGVSNEYVKVYSGKTIVIARHGGPISFHICNHPIVTTRNRNPNQHKINYFLLVSTYLGNQHRNRVIVPLKSTE